jgi:phospholipase/carboxylesterase
VLKTCFGISERRTKKQALRSSRQTLATKRGTQLAAASVINGDLFPRVVAFSPGFVISGTPHGKPRMFISHGTHDHILPIDRCGRRIAATLISHGYEVTFREFDGNHEIPTDIAREGLKWMTA